MAEETTPKRGRGRPRREGADEEILSVARAMLSERGYSALSVDEIAERAGVAKTTVYRRWPSKGLLVAAAIAPAAPNAATPEELLQETQALLEPLAGADDAEILAVVRAILGPRRTRLAELLGGDATRADELLGALWVGLFV